MCRFRRTRELNAFPLIASPTSPSRTVELVWDRPTLPDSFPSSKQNEPASLMNVADVPWGSHEHSPGLDDTGEGPSTCCGTVGAVVGIDMDRLEVYDCIWMIWLSRSGSCAVALATRSHCGTARTSTKDIRMWRGVGHKRS